MQSRSARHTSSWLLCYRLARHGLLSNSLGLGGPLGGPWGSCGGWPHWSRVLGGTGRGRGCTSADWQLRCCAPIACSTIPDHASESDSLSSWMLGSKGKITHICIAKVAASCAPSSQYSYYKGRSKVHDADVCFVRRSYCCQCSDIR